MKIVKKITFGKKVIMSVYKGITLIWGKFITWSDKFIWRDNNIWYSK